VSAFIITLATVLSSAKCSYRRPSPRSQPAAWWQCDKPSSYVRLLGVTTAADLGLDKHVSNVCNICFFWLRQLRRVHCSLDIVSAKTLVHAFVKSCVNYCNSVLSSVPKKVMDKLQHVQNVHLLTLCNFVKFQPILKIFALLENVWNLLQNSYDITHLTFGMLLHYLGKLKIHGQTHTCARTHAKT